MLTWIHHNNPKVSNENKVECFYCAYYTSLSALNVRSKRYQKVTKGVLYERSMGVGRGGKGRTPLDFHT